MKVILHKSSLLKVVQRIQGALSEKSLAHISLKACKNRLQVSAADRIMAIYAFCDVKVQSEGEAFIAAKLFSDIVKELPQEEISLCSDEAFLLIRSLGPTSFLMKVPKITGLSWPKPPEVEENSVRLQIPSKKLAYMLEQACYCVAQESPRNYASVGFLHKVSNKELRLVGTDGFRLSYCSIDFDMPDNFLTKGLSLSKRALTELLKLCYESQDALSFSISQNTTTALAEIEDCKIYILLSAVKYPNYRSVLPKKLTKKAKISRSTMQAVTRRVLLAADKTRALQLSFLNSQLKLSSRTLGSTEGHENIEITGYNGEDCQLALNGKFLTDIFSTAASDTIVISFASEEQPVAFVAQEEPAGCVSQHILVPIRESK